MDVDVGFALSTYMYIKNLGMLSWFFMLGLELSMVEVSGAVYVSQDVGLKNMYHQEVAHHPNYKPL